MTKKKKPVIIHPADYLQAVKDTGLRVILVDDISDLLGQKFETTQAVLNALPELVRVGPRAYSLKERV